MTEFKRTTQAVDEIEKLVQVVLAGGDGVSAAVPRLAQLVADTTPTIARLKAKADETDPLKTTYGPQMREKVQALIARWATVSELCGDVLRQSGAEALVAAPRPAAPAPAQAPRQEWHRVQPVHGTQLPTAAGGRFSPVDGPPAAAASPTAQERREMAARAAEARSGGGILAQPRPVPAVTPASSSTPASALAAAPSGSAALPAVPVVARMEGLMHLVHCVFLRHGFERVVPMDVDGEAPAKDNFHVAYGHKSLLGIVARYVPVQQHLIVYASIEGSGEVTHAAVQLGMDVVSVQAKMDYLLVYPLVCRLAVPELQAVPTEALFGLLCHLAIPAMAAFGCASRGMKVAVLEDDVLWWSVLCALPSRPELMAAIGQAGGGKEGPRQAPAGTWRSLVEREVEFHRAKAEEEERMRKEEAEARLRFRDPLMVQPPRRPGFPGFPGGLGGSPHIIGGYHDIMPGGGFGPGFGDPRRGPFGGGGGGGGFGGGMF